MFNTHDFLTYTAPENALQNRVIVVTGAGSGIGREAAKCFAQYGATVVLLGRTLSKLESVYDEIEKAGLPQPAIFPVNFESAVQQDYDQLKQALKNEFNRVDGLLHNAAELGPRTPIENYSFSEWQKILHVNVTAPFMLTRTLLPLLKQSTDGRILFTGAHVGVKGRAYWGGYAAAKSAVINLMETLADELEETKIRTNCIDPGAVRSGIRANAYPAEDPQTVPSASSIMNQYVYLIGPASIHCNGLLLTAQSETAME